VISSGLARTNDQRSVLLSWFITFKIQDSCGRHSVTKNLRITSNLLAPWAKLAVNGSVQHVYEVHPRKDNRGFDLVSDVLPFGRLWYGEPECDPATQSDMRSTTARHIDAAIRGKARGMPA